MSGVVTPKMGHNPTPWIVSPDNPFLVKDAIGDDERAGQGRCRVKVTIGSRYDAKPSMFSRRDADGAFSHTLPPMTAVDEQLQHALLVHEDVSHPADRWVAILAYAGVTGLAIAWVIARVLA